jgi:3-hydroxybutyryl-CoA dehydrogenase
MIESVGIVGAGAMGSGIAHVCAAAGLPSVMADVSGAAPTRGLGALSGGLERPVRKHNLHGKVQEGNRS